MERKHSSKKPVLFDEQILGRLIPLLPELGIGRHVVSRFVVVEIAGRTGGAHQPQPENGARYTHRAPVIIKGETYSALSSAPEIDGSERNHELVIRLYYPAALKR